MIVYFFLAKCLPYFIHNKTLNVKPNKNPATHWSGCSFKKGLVINGPKKNVKKE